MMSAARLLSAGLAADNAPAERHLPDRLPRQLVNGAQPAAIQALPPGRKSRLCPGPYRASGRLLPRLGRSDAGGRLAAGAFAAVFGSAWVGRRGRRALVAELDDRKPPAGGGGACEGAADERVCQRSVGRAGEPGVTPERPPSCERLDGDIKASERRRFLPRRLGPAPSAWRRSASRSARSTPCGLR
jgi:hypothetical protein